MARRKLRTFERLEDRLVMASDTSSGIGLLGQYYNQPTSQGFRQVESMHRSISIGAKDRLVHRSIPIHSRFAGAVKSRRSIPNRTRCF